MKRFIFILFAFAAFSYTSNALQPSIEPLNHVRDVGWIHESKISLAQQPKVFELTVTKHFSNTLQSTWQEQEDAMRSYALPAGQFRYDTKKFYSHNRKLNRKHKQKYGITKAKHDTNKIEDSEAIVDPDFIPILWQWIASNVKDQA